MWSSLRSFSDRSMSNEKSKKVCSTDEEKSQTERSVGASTRVSDDVDQGQTAKECCEQMEYMQEKIIRIAEMVLSLSKEVKNTMEKLCDCKTKKTKLCGLVRCCYKKSM